MVFFVLFCTHLFFLAETPCQIRKKTPPTSPLHCNGCWVCNFWISEALYKPEPSDFSELLKPELLSLLFSESPAKVTGIGLLVSSVQKYVTVGGHSLSYCAQALWCSWPIDIGNVPTFPLWESEFALFIQMLN